MNNEPLEPASSSRDPRQLEQTLGYTFVNRELLQRALCHESFINENEAGRSNERLEFLGDSVLGLVVAQGLFRRFPELPEGKLAVMKAYLVSTRHLAEKARELELLDYLKLGRGERASQRGKRRSLLADGFEAVLGAVYLDGGLAAAETLVERFFGGDLDRKVGLSKDYKSLLQELTQSYFKALPQYRLVSESGPSHDRTFVVEVLFENETLGQGTGSSKREAGQMAAALALERFHKNDEVWNRLLKDVVPQSESH